MVLLELCDCPDFLIGTNACGAKLAIPFPPLDQTPDSGKDEGLQKPKRPIATAEITSAETDDREDDHQDDSGISDRLLERKNCADAPNYTKNEQRAPNHSSHRAYGDVVPKEEKQNSGEPHRNEREAATEKNNRRTGPVPGLGPELSP
jgi:hypothetical protein